MNENVFTKKSMEELGRLSAEENKQASHYSIKIILDDVRSMNNVGSVFRTADALNVEEIILCGVTPQPPHRDIHKTALGATESVQWQYEPNIETILPSLKNNNYIIVGVEQTQNSVLLNQVNFPKDQKIALIFGNEVTGVSDNALALCDYVIEIPQWGAKHSLNISVAVGVTLWEFVREL